MVRVFIYSVVGALLIALGGCGGDETACDPGTERLCLCDNVRRGTKTCGAGSVWGVCECSTPDAALPDAAHDAAGPDASAADAGPTEAGAADAAADQLTVDATADQLAVDAAADQLAVDAAADQGAADSSADQLADTTVDQLADTTPDQLAADAISGDATTPDAGADAFSADAGVCSGSSISSVTPNYAVPGDTVTISGTNFGSDQGLGEVLFGATPATNIVSWSMTTIEVQIPTMSLGSVVVTVRYDGQTCSTFSPYSVGGCVAPGTSVLLADGTSKPIEQVAVGDALRAVDLGSLDSAGARVETLLVHRASSYSLDLITFGPGESLRITGNHPVLVAGDRWVTVDALRPGDVIHVFNPRSGRAEPRTVGSIVRDESRSAVVYNLKTSAAHYFANGVLVHNKCLAAGSLVETPAGPRPVESLRVGELVYGSRAGRRVRAAITHVYTKATVLPALPGRRISANLTVTDNHRIFDGTRFVRAGDTAHPAARVFGTVYDLQTETGNYFADGVLTQAGR